MKKLLLIVALTLMCNSVFASTYSITIDDKYVPYIQKKADSEGKTIEELIEQFLLETAKNRIDSEYSKTVADKLTTQNKIDSLEEVIK